MKLKNNKLGTGFASILVIGLLASGTAFGQTLFYQNAGSGANAGANGGTSGGNLATLGYDSYGANEFTGVTLTDTGALSTRPQQSTLIRALDINFTAANLAAITPVNTTLSSVTIYLYAESVNPDGSTQGFSLYDGLNGAGSFISNVNLIGPGDEGKFFSFTVTGDQFLGGMSLTSKGLSTSTLLNISSELNATPLQTPGVSLTFSPVPEPSTALLGAIGSLALLRRRRNA